MTRALTTIDSGYSVPSSPPEHDGVSSSVAWTDWLGMLASIGCAIHCAAMPFVIAYLPALGLSFLADEAFHRWMAVGCFAIAVTAFLPGLRKHRRLAPVMVGSVGLMMISIAAFGFAGECCEPCEGDPTPVAASVASDCGDSGCSLCPSASPDASSIVANKLPVNLNEASDGSSPWLGLVVTWLTPLGGMVLVCAHLLNRRYGCLCVCCSIKNIAVEEAT